MQSCAPSTAGRAVVICQYCKKEAELVPGSAVKSTKHQHVWFCRPCHAWVGVFSDSTRFAPMGELAKESLRAARSRAYTAFDACWHLAVVCNGWTNTKARKMSIGFLAQRLGIKPKDWNMGTMNEAALLRLAAICERFSKGAAA